MELDIELWKRGGCPVCGGQRVASAGDTYTCQHCFIDRKAEWRKAMDEIHKLDLCGPVIVRAPDAPSPPPKVNRPVYVIGTDVGDRLFTFLCHLRLEDQPVAVQREYIAVVRELKREMGRGGDR